MLTCAIADKLLIPSAGMELPKSIGCINRHLTLHEVLHYFRDNHSYPASKTPAIRPNGGELFLFSLPFSNQGKYSSECRDGISS